MKKNPELLKYETVARSVKKAVEILQAMPYQKDQEAALLGARRALQAAENRIAVLKVYAPKVD